MRGRIGVMRDTTEDNVKDDDVNDTEDTEDETEACLGERQPLANLTMNRKLRVSREGLVAEVDEVDTDNIKEVEEEDEDTFQLVDKRAKALLQPRELCQHK